MFGVCRLEARASEVPSCNANGSDGVHRGTHLTRARVPNEIMHVIMQSSVKTAHTAHAERLWANQSSRARFMVQSTARSRTR